MRRCNFALIYTVCLLLSGDNLTQRLGMQCCLRSWEQGYGWTEANVIRKKLMCFIIDLELDSQSLSYICKQGWSFGVWFTRKLTATSALVFFSKISHVWAGRNPALLLLYLNTGHTQQLCCWQFHHHQRWKIHTKEQMHPPHDPNDFFGSESRIIWPTECSSDASVVPFGSL